MDITEDVGKLRERVKFMTVDEKADIEKALNAMTKGRRCIRFCPCEQCSLNTAPGVCDILALGAKLALPFFLKDEQVIVPEPGRPEFILPLIEEGWELLPENVSFKVGDKYSFPGDEDWFRVYSLDAVRPGATYIRKIKPEIPGLMEGCEAVVVGTDKDGRFEGELRFGKDNYALDVVIRCIRWTGRYGYKMQDNCVYWLTTPRGKGGSIPDYVEMQKKSQE